MLKCPTGFITHQGKTNLLEKAYKKLSCFAPGRTPGRTLGRTPGRTLFGTFLSLISVMNLMTHDTINCNDFNDNNDFNDSNDFND